MKAEHTPTPVIRTKATSITVTSKDVDDGHPVNGTVKIGGTVVGPTGAAFAFTFAASGAPPVSVVEAADYAPASIAWNLVDPPPAPPATLSLSIANQSPYLTITSVSWSIVLHEISGDTLVASPTGASVSVPLAKNGQYHIQAEVWVDNATNGSNELAEFRGNQIISGVSVLVLVWSNTAQSHTMRLILEPQQIWGGGGVFTVYNPVVVQ